MVQYRLIYFNFILLKEIVNLTIVVPFFGRVIGGGIDWIATKKIAKIARNTLTYSFLKG